MYERCACCAERFGVSLFLLRTENVSTSYYRSDLEKVLITVTFKMIDDHSNLKCPTQLNDVMQ